MICGFHTVGLLILILSFQSQSEVISLFERAKIGDDVILRCYLGPVSDFSNMTVEWSRPNLDPRFISVWPERPELQNPAYKGRTSLNTDGMKDGYISLKISDVKRSDEGMYTCFSPELDEKSTVQLIVYGEFIKFWDHSAPEVNDDVTGLGTGVIAVIGSIALCLILAVAFIVWKQTQGKFNKKEKRMEDGPDQNRKESVIYSRKDNSEFKVTMERGESEMLMTGREEKEKPDEHVIETELIGDTERPEGERIIPSINIEKDSQSTTDQETDEENEMTGRSVKAEGGEDKGEKMMESVKYYLGVQFLPLKHKEKLMSGKSSSMEWGTYFNLDQKEQSEQEEQFVEERETESDVDIKQLNNKKKRSKNKKTQVNNPCSGFPPQKTKQQKEENQRTLQSETRMKGENNETEIQTQKDKDNQHRTKEKQQDRNKPEDQEGKDEKRKPERQ